MVSFPRVKGFNVNEVAAVLIGKEGHVIGLVVYFHLGDQECAEHGCGIRLGSVDAD
jgi:hypothetical protein